MRGRLKELNFEMWRILLDPRASRLERLESGRIIAALHGILVGSPVGESALSAKAITQLRAARAEIAERLFRKKKQKQGQNQRAHLRRQIRQLEQQSTKENMEENGSTAATR